MLQIRDSVHGYISLDPMFADIVNTPEFQRLRSIEQGSFRVVFPGARHDRFTHSLGTYHLATKFVEHFFRNLRRDVAEIRLTKEAQHDLSLTFRYAALLHDVGHAPYSHTTEGFFLEKKDPASPKTPLIWTQLCEEVRAVAAPADYLRFKNSTAKPRGAAHEIMSAVLLIRNRDRFLPAGANVDLELAARMVIGYPFSKHDAGAEDLTDDEIQLLGIKNCLIGLLNSSIMDVDRMDYLGRDTQMSGFVNAPVDLDCLAASVTAVTLPDGWLAPAFRDDAISVIDTMFHAKLSHDAWVLAHPAGAYDAALLEHCIRCLNDRIDPAYMSTVFSVEAMGRDGVSLGGKTYRLLSDVDVGADLKSQSGAPFDEMYTRVLGQRRIAAWRSYFEFRHLFDDPSSGLSADDVYKFFAPLIDYIDREHLFVFNRDTAALILGETPLPAGMSAAGAEAKRAAKFLRKYLESLTSDPGKKGSYNVVLLKRTNNYTMKIDPKDVRIVFTRKSMPARLNGQNFSTYSQLRQITLSDNRANQYFYLFRHGGLGSKQLEKLRKWLIREL